MIFSLYGNSRDLLTLSFKDNALIKYMTQVRISQTLSVGIKAAVLRPFVIIPKDTLVRVTSAHSVDKFIQDAPSVCSGLRTSRIGDPA